MVYLQNEQEREAIRWMNEAAKLAERALCSRAKCGTIIVKGGEIIGEGYNAPPLDLVEHSMCNADRSFGQPKYDKTCCLHSEWRAILDALKRNAGKVSGSKLYFVRVDEDGKTKRSGKPYCTVCSRLALDVGIDTFLLWHEEGVCEYPTDEYNRLSYEYVPEN